MMRMSRRCVAAVCVALGGVGAGTAVAQDSLPASDAVMKACSEELARAMTLRMEDLEKPYFIQIIVDDTLRYRMAAEQGALVSSNQNRSRNLFTDVRVGSYALDNSNFAEGGGMFAGIGRRGRRPARGGADVSLPLDNDEMALRQALWAALDEDYKGAVETMAQKRAYMKDKNLTDRPDDYAKAEPSTANEPGATLVFDRAGWERNIQQLSERFKRYPQIQDSNVQLAAGMSNSYILTSEGTRVRRADTGVVVTINAEGQAEDGMRFSNELHYVGESVADLPPVEKMSADIDAMVANLTAAMKAPILESYTGPVLFDGRAATQLFRSMLANGVAGRPEPLGMQRRGRQGSEGLDKQLGLAILPKSFNVYDDPTQKKAGDTVLAGHYTYDDEGIPAQRVEIVKNGILKGMCMSRTPTKKLSGSNGHGRQAGAGAPRAAIGCLFIEDKKGVSDEELKAKLIEAAKEAGLDYGIRIGSIKSIGLGGSRADILALIGRARRGGGRGMGGAGGLGDPVLVYKVFVKDGHEEPVRGCEFGDMDVKALKKILASGKTPHVSNSAGAGASASIIAPSVLVDDVELTSIEQENDTLPLLKAPGARGGDTLGAKTD